MKIGRKQYFEDWIGYGALFIFFCAVLWAGFRILPSGYGDNIDNYGMLRAWQAMLIDGKYVPSRFQGNLPSEIVLGFFASLFGPIGSNSVSLVASLSALGIAGILLNRIEQGALRIGLALATVAVNPYWLRASLTSMDYVHPIPLYLGAILLTLRGLPFIAVIFFALAGGVRISYAPLGFLTLCLLHWQKDESGSRQQLIECLCTFIVITGLIYVPVWITSHLSLSFLTSARPTEQGFTGIAARFVYKLIYLYGLAGTLVVVAILINQLFHRNKAGQAVGEASKFEFTIYIIIIFHLILFLYIPVRIEYLLPLLLCFAALCVIWKVNNVALIILACLEVSYWFVNVDLLRIQYASNDPCAAVVALGAGFQPHRTEGVLIRNIEGKTNEYCYSNSLIIQPKILSDPLPPPIF